MQKNIQIQKKHSFKDNTYTISIINNQSMNYYDESVSKRIRVCIWDWNDQIMNKKKLIFSLIFHFIIFKKVHFENQEKNLNF